jgi:hypothetical protein
MRFSAPALAAMLLLAAIVLSCSRGPRRPATYPVSGTITWKGQPVEGAVVVFVPTGDFEPAAGTTDAAGKYQLTTFVAGDGAQAGEYRVKVSKYETPSNEFSEFRAPPLKSVLPVKYDSDSTSGIVLTVSKQPNTLDIKLE